MERALWFGICVLVILFLFFAARYKYLSVKLERYIRESHPQEWDTIFGDLRELFLWSFVRASVEFWRAEDDLGDSRIADLKRRSKRAANLSGLSALAGFFWGIVFGVVLPMALAV